MKKIVSIFAVCFMVALIFPAEAPAPIAQCGDGIVNQVGEICDGDDDAACPGECKDDCTCPECDDGILDPGEECDPSADPTGCSEGSLCTDACVCEAIPTIAPASVTGCPVMPTECEVIETECPATVTACEIIETECPAEITACIVDPTYCPMDECGGEGCTPGYWKQPQHADSWVATGYAPDDMFCDIPSIECAFPGMMMVEVLWQGGGGINALGRHTVAALLNAASPDVSYDLDEAAIINMFNGVYPEGPFNPTKDVLENFNEQGCPID